MRNLFLIIALLASTAALSQATLVVNDLQYSEGVETEWSVLYIPHYPEIEGGHLEEGDGWKFDYRGEHRLFRLRGDKPGIYQVKQMIGDSLIQISSIRID